MTHEDWCDLLSTIKVKFNRKRASTQTKKISSDKSSSRSDRDGLFRIPRKNKARTGFLLNNKVPPKKAPNHCGNQHHCVIFKKAGITEQKYMSHSAEDYFGKSYNQDTIKDGLGGTM